MKNQIFHEIYGIYYQTVSEVLGIAVKRGITSKEIRQIVQKRAFGESGMSIPDALVGREWPLLNQEGAALLYRKPLMPLTDLQIRWMKALLLDKRMRLFEPDMDGLEEVKPLFEPGQIVFFDRYGNGDPYEDEHYIKHFHVIRDALQMQKSDEKSSLLEIVFDDQYGMEHRVVCEPEKLEYSSRDDKFRLICKKPNITINLARIRMCQCTAKCETECEEEFYEIDGGERYLVMELMDQRNALERIMLHFSHLKKETKKLGQERYQVKLYYDAGDETEMLIRILSFGPMIRVVEPEPFVQKLRERLERQFATFFP